MLFSNFLMSISQILLCGNWLAEGNLRKKCLSFLHNSTALVITSFFILHLLGLIYSKDLIYGLHDIKVKLPVLILPLVISTSPVIDRKTSHRLLIYFVAVVFAASLVSFFIKLSGKIIDVRETSMFISHIRFSLNVCIAFFIAIYFITNPKSPVFIRIVLSTICLWLIVFLIILEAATGIVIIVVVTVLVLLYLIFSKKQLSIKIPAALCLVLLPCFSVWYCYHTINSYNHAPQVDLNKLEKCTLLGNPYTHDTSYFTIENGHYPGLYICSKELIGEWNKRSRVKISVINGKYPMIYYTLIRYMSTKGYRKDGGGVRMLTEEDIKAVENGHANREYLNVFSLKSRLYKIAFEYNSYRRSGNARNMSVMQRIELWKTAYSLIRKNFWFGVGTGDVKTAFKNELIIQNSSLKDKGLRAHNQFFTIFIAFGLIGFIWFLLALFYPLFHFKKHFTYFFVIFLIVVVISMLTEDTLETQAGATLFAFFTSFLLFNNDHYSNLS